MLRQVAGDLYQAGETVFGKDGWGEAVRVYVLMNDGNPLIFDAGSHIHRQQIMQSLVELFDGASPKYVFLTHTELPHTGNLRAILDKWPDAKIVVSSGILPHVELPWWLRSDQVNYCAPGSTENFSGREVSFSDAILKDQPGTQWMYDRQTKTLFTADAYGYVLSDETDAKFDDELEDGIETTCFQAYHKSAFRFLPMVMGERVNSDLNKVFSAREVSIIAPTHGNAIRGNIPLHQLRMAKAIGAICQ